jgi:phage-related protein
MNLREELKKMDGCVGNEVAFKRHYLWLKNNFTGEQDTKEIDDYAEKLLIQSMSETGEAIKAFTVKMQLSTNAEMIPLAYIAKRYFNKTKNWLYQRINGNIVNGKPAKFTDEEKKIFNDALKDISKKIGSINIA